MTLLAGEKLEKDRFFQSGNPKRQGSSFDLTIGKIFDNDGRRVEEQHTLRPNEMIQVVSDEVFALPSNITAHVTYKTTMTSQGIWALTVGIVDPGWNCPISTTLFNFGKSDFAVQEGDTFLRVSFFEHAPVDDKYLRKGEGGKEAYFRKVQRTASTSFSRQFLDVDRVSKEAGGVAVRLMQEKALSWVALAAFLFALIQIVMSWGPPAVVWYFEGRASDAKQSDIQDLREELQEIQALLRSAQGLISDESRASAPDRETPAETVE